MYWFVKTSAAKVLAFMLYSMTILSFKEYALLRLFGKPTNNDKDNQTRENFYTSNDATSKIK